MKKNNKSNYDKLNSLFGLGPDEQTYNPADYKGQSLVFSCDKEQSSIPPMVKSVGSIEELKEILAVSNSASSGNVTYPEPIEEDQVGIENSTDSKAELVKKLSPGTRANLTKAAYAYVIGDPGKVKEYVPLINAIMFPVDVGYFASTEDKIIDSEIRITGPGPVVWNYNNIIFKEGGSVEAEVEFSINCATISKE